LCHIFLKIILYIYIYIYARLFKIIIIGHNWCAWNKIGSERSKEESFLITCFKNRIAFVYNGSFVSKVCGQCSFLRFSCLAFLLIHVLYFVSENIVVRCLCYRECFLFIRIESSQEERWIKMRELYKMISHALMRL